MGKSAVIIGGGVGGLSAAIQLARRGIRVTLLEKNARVGGKLNLWAEPHPNRAALPQDVRPFKFDTGPSLLTLPLIFQDLFTAAGEDVRDYLSIARLDPIARYSWPDGTTFELRADEPARLEEVRKIAPDDVAGFQRLLARGESIWSLSADAFLFHAPEQMLRRGRFSPLAGLKLLTTPFRIGMFSNYARLIDRHIKSDKLRQVFYQYATYSGASPFRAPATFAVIPFVEMSFGGWYIPGGMYKLAEALEAVARKLGVEIRTECEVAQILVESARRPRATGVKTRAGETISADCVIANSDVVYTYHELIDARFRKRYSDEKLTKIEPGGSGLVLLLGVEGTYPQLAHHNKFMPDDYSSDLRAMFETHTIPAQRSNAGPRGLRKPLRPRQRPGAGFKDRLDFPGQAVPRSTRPDT
jgi:phytoene desaturase